jgi:hypothetical protein
VGVTQGASLIIPQSLSVPQSFSVNKSDCCHEMKVVDAGIKPHEPNPMLPESNQNPSARFRRALEPYREEGHTEGAA